MQRDADISIGLNIDTFTPPDNRDLEEHLRAESELRIESHIFAASTAPGGTPPPDMVISILYTLIPVADIYANVLASAIWDLARSAHARQGKDDSEVTFSLVERDDDGNVRRQIRGATRNPEAIEALISQFGKDQQ